MGSAVTLEQSVSLGASALEQANTLADGGKMVLFTGVDELILGSGEHAQVFNLGNGISEESYLSASNYFSNLGNNSLLLYFSGEAGGTLGIMSSLAQAIPEPSVFGLLTGLGALALVSSRRRRKASCLRLPIEIPFFDLGSSFLPFCSPECVRRRCTTLDNRGCRRKSEPADRRPCCLAPIKDTLTSLTLLRRNGMSCVFSQKRISRDLSTKRARSLFHCAVGISGTNLHRLAAHKARGLSAGFGSACTRGYPM